MRNSPASVLRSSSQTPLGDFRPRSLPKLTPANFKTWIRPSNPVVFW